jgi:hypothetical protein
VKEKNMSANIFIIECDRCGETRLEPLAESEARAVSGAINSLSRYCAQCGSTTGWLTWQQKLNDELSKPSTHEGVGRIAARPVPAGQERLASRSELDAISEILQQRKAAPPGRADERSWPSPRQESSEEGDSPVWNGGVINRFLLCTIVWSVAREVKAKGETNGERLPMQRIAREVLCSYLQEWAPSERYLLEEEALEDAIKRRLYELFKQSRLQYAEERRFDIDSLVAAEQTKRRCQNVKP